MSAWASWDEFKSGYGDSYGVLAESLHREASQEWEVLSQIIQDGEELHKGDVRQVAMLWMSPTITLSGTGAAYVQGELIAQQGLPPSYQITVVDSSPGDELPLVVAIKYPNGITEQVRFWIVESHNVWLPLVLRNANGGTVVLTQRPMSTEDTQGFGTWHYYWAGSEPDQRLYSAIPAGSPPNSTGCASASGATAWAMLFGWADYQASIGNPYWRLRWGLYREDGGYGADAVAPRDMDDGVEHMTWEINGLIDAYCLDSTPATQPSDMANAAQYLAGRTYTTLDTYYASDWIPTYDLFREARSSIRDRGTPAIIGTGWQYHPLAWAYGWRKCIARGRQVYAQHQFLVNQGQGDTYDGWVVTARTWFVGQIYP
jgi:hypothetical protein